jgi:hypothetical protein
VDVKALHETDMYSSFALQIYQIPSEAVESLNDLWRNSLTIFFYSVSKKLIELFVLCCINEENIITACCEMYVNFLEFNVSTENDYVTTKMVDLNLYIENG